MTKTIVKCDACGKEAPEQNPAFGKNSPPGWYWVAYRTGATADICSQMCLINWAQKKFAPADPVPLCGYCHSPLQVGVCRNEKCL